MVVGRSWSSVISNFFSAFSIKKINLILMTNRVTNLYFGKELFFKAWMMI